MTPGNAAEDRSGDLADKPLHIDVLRGSPTPEELAAIVAVVVSGVLLLRPPAQRTFDVAFQPTELAPTAAGSAVMLKSDSGWEIKLNVTGLPRLDNGRFYQGWLRNADGVLVPIGTFNEGTDVVLWSGVSPDAFPTMTITQEQADGNQDSSGQRVLVGTAVEVK